MTNLRAKSNPWIIFQGLYDDGFSQLHIDVVSAILDRNDTTAMPARNQRNSNQ
jgi:hypothetical protein